MNHVVIHTTPGRYYGQPANNGIWIWGDEILVGSVAGHYDWKENDNNLNREFPPYEKLLYRSMDSGETWTVEPAGGVYLLYEEPIPRTGDIDFTHPDFAMRCGGKNIAFKTAGEKFIVSYDRGRTWKGPYLLPETGNKLTSRTDYIVNGPKDCYFFLSDWSPEIEAKLKDRMYCARTMDGGKTFEFLSYITDDKARSVMSSTVKCPDGKLITAMRRRKDIDYNEIESNYKHSSVDDANKIRQDERFKPAEFMSKRHLGWIDLYQSEDEGRSWKFLSKAAVTDPTEKRNGNPPALVRLQDGRLVIAYGYRGTPEGIRAKISNDEGKTWGDEIILRDDAFHWDIGYPRMVQRSDGKLLTIYYYSTKEHPEQHLEATIWDPDLY